MQKNILPPQRFTIEDVAFFAGNQESPNVAPYFGKPVEYWTLTETLRPDLIQFSTVSREKIEAALTK